MAFRFANRLLNPTPANLSVFRWASVKARAAVCKEVGKPLEIGEVKIKNPVGDQILVRVNACAVDPLDVRLTSQVEGETDIAFSTTKPKVPFAAGFQISGEVLAVGDKVPNGKFNEGDRVVGLSLAGKFGGFASHCLLSCEDVWTLPHSIPTDMGAALAYPYATAIAILSHQMKLGSIKSKEPPVVLVTGAAGGTGMAVVDVAATVYRSKVMGVCRTETRASFVREKKGAWSALSYDAKDMKKSVQKLTNGIGVDVAVDTVGGDKVVSAVMDCIREEGKLVMTPEAHSATIDSNKLIERAVSVSALSLEQIRRYNPALYRQFVTDAIELCQEGMIKPYIGATFPLSKVNDALDSVRREGEKDSAVGKVIVLTEE